MSCSRKKAFYIFLIIITIPILFSILFSNFLLHSYKEIDLELNIRNYTSFNLGGSTINFGTLEPGSIAKRNITVTNDDCKKCKVNIKIKDLTNWIEISENDFILLRGEYKNIELKANPKPPANFGNYTGKLKIYFWKTI
jgi:hypothetical protein